MGLLLLFGVVHVFQQTRKVSEIWRRDDTSVLGAIDRVGELVLTRATDDKCHSWQNYNFHHRYGKYLSLSRSPSPN